MRIFWLGGCDITITDCGCVYTPPTTPLKKGKGRTSCLIQDQLHQSSLLDSSGILRVRSRSRDYSQKFGTLISYRLFLRSGYSPESASRWEILETLFRTFAKWSNDFVYIKGSESKQNFRNRSEPIIVYLLGRLSGCNQGECLFFFKTNILCCGDRSRLWHEEEKKNLPGIPWQNMARVTSASLILGTENRPLFFFHPLPEIREAKKTKAFCSLYQQFYAIQNRKRRPRNSMTR